MEPTFHKHSTLKKILGRECVGWTKQKKQRYRDLNPGFLAENQASWTRLDDSAVSNAVMQRGVQPVRHSRHVAI